MQTLHHDTDIGDIVFCVFQLSCTVGHGALRELVTMNSKGQVPLVAHFLYIHQLQNTTQPSGMKLLRTETITEEYLFYIASDYFNFMWFYYEYLNVNYD